jgi:hypothetical protein
MTLPRATVVRRVAALGLVLSLVLAACGGASATPTPTPAPTPTATPTPEPTPEPTPTPTPTQATGGTGLSGAAAALENLTSYRFAISISGDVGVPGMPADTALTMDGTVVLKPDRAVQFTITGLSGDTAITYILVGSVAWVDLGSGTYIQVPADEANVEQLFETFQPQNLFGADYSSLFGSVLTVGDEEKNGILATHYHLDKDSPGSAALVAQFGADGVFDAWIAKEGGYLVGIHVKGTQQKAGKAVPFEVSFEISHIDDPANVVEPPRT